MEKEERVCEYCGAEHNLKKDEKKTKIAAIIRTKYVCDNCFALFRKDNQLRNDKGMSIPNNFKTIGVQQ